MASSPALLLSSSSPSTSFSSTLSSSSSSFGNPISGQPTLSDFDKLLKMAGLAGVITTIAVVFSILCLILAGLRMVVRHHRENMAIDDYLMLAGSIFFCFNNALAIVATLSGIGVEDFEIDFTKPLEGSKWIIFWGFAYAISTIPLKVSFCLSLFRIDRSATTRAAAYGLSLLTVVAAAVQILWVAFACRPFSYLWDAVTQRGTCIHIETTVVSIYLFACVCIIVDCGVALYVLPLLWNLQMRWPRKLMAWMIYTLGVLASIATVVRLFYLPAYVDMGYWVPGFYYELGGVVVCSQFEVGLAIIGGCLPSTRQGLRLVNWRFWKKLNGRYRFIKPQHIAANVSRSAFDQPLISPSRMELPIAISIPDIIRVPADRASSTSDMPTAASSSSIPPVPSVPERYLASVAPTVPVTSTTTSNLVRSPSKSFGLTTTITAGLSEENKKARKRKQKQRKRNVCSECGKRNCQEHTEVLDPSNPPLDGIVVTKTIEQTVTYEPTGTYGWPSGASGIHTRGGFSTSIQSGSSSTPQPSSRGTQATRGPRGPRHRPIEIRQEGIPLNTLTSTGRLDPINSNIDGDIATSDRGQDSTSV